MTSQKLVRSHGTFLLIVAYVAATFEHSPVGERPLTSAISILFSCGFVLSRFQNWFSGLLSKAAVNQVDDGFKNEVIGGGGGDAPVPTGSRRDTLSQGADIVRSVPDKTRKDTIIPLAVAVSLRSLLLRSSLFEGKCTIPSVNAYLPLIIAISAFARPQQFGQQSQHSSRRSRRSHDDWGMPPAPERGPLSASVYLLCSFVLVIASALGTWVTYPLPTTHICFADVISRTTNVCLPLLGLGADAYILLKADTLIRDPVGESQAGLPPSHVIAACMKLAAKILTLLGCLGLAFQPITWQSVIFVELGFLVSISGYVVISGLALISAMSIISETGAFHLVFIAISATMLTTTVKYTITINPFVTSISSWKIALFLSSLWLVVELYARMTAAFGLLTASKSSRSIPRLYTTLVSVTLAAVTVWSWSHWPKPVYSGHYPIDDFIDQGISRSQSWLSQASQGMSLETSIQNYRKRHGRRPPPGFDNWYRYATQRSSYIIDDFDTLYDDLQPFWGITPAEIRSLTEQATDNPASRIAKIEIRKGHAKLASARIVGKERVVGGFILMANQFAKHLPDMDVALNLNEEPRVAVPYGEMARLLDAASSAKPLIDTIFKWSDNRADSWQEARNTGSLVFANRSGVNSFTSSTVGCPPGSLARKYNNWDPAASCSNCTAHSQAGIIRDWKLALSPCHQPDLRNLHGYFASPRTSQITHKLLPIFSPSKISGFADILIPASRDYRRKPHYLLENITVADPPFMQKKNSLFWRGNTTEGTSHSGMWRNFLRQRLVHIASKLPLKTKSPDMPILLPDFYTDSKYGVQYPEFTYKHVAPTLNISFANIDHATSFDRAAQISHFGTTPRVDIHEHWRHRYLFVMDGAAISHNFIPFMQSHSLPFRSGIFKAWYDGRLTPWAHFIPIDVRLTGLFSTLAYFAGTDGVKGAKTLKARVGMERREYIAERIAEDGRDWAQKVLRQEDMEIYLFRLLLEWGRLTDDKRDELGLVV